MFTKALEVLLNKVDGCPWDGAAGRARPVPFRLYTPEERRRRDASPWTLVQGVLAPVQFAVFLVSLVLVLRFLATGDGEALATASVVVKTLALYAIMVTGSIWEREVFGRYLFAPAFFWEDVVSMLVLALHTAYLAALLTGALDPHGADAAGAGRLRHLRGQRRRSSCSSCAPRGCDAAEPATPALGQLSMSAAPPRSAARDAPVLRERGQREVFCGLTGIIWLHRKIQDAFFLVVGSRTCAHLIQSAAGVMIFAEPRFATAIIDERDLAGLADANDELDRVVARLLERRPDIRLLFLVGSCPSEVIKLDLSRAAQRLSATLRAASARAELFGQRHRDHLHPGRGCLPRRAGADPAARAADAPSLLVVGALAEVVEDQFRRLFDALGIGPGALPAAAPRRRPAARRARHADAAGAALPGRDGARARGARRRPACRRRSRSASKAPRAWLRAAADAFGVEPRRASSAATAPAASARAAPPSPATAPVLAGKRVFFFPDSQLEMPLARFLAARTRHGAGRSRHALSAPPASGGRTRPAAGRDHAQRGPGRRPAARPLPRRRSPTSWSAASGWPIRSRPRA